MSTRSIDVRVTDSDGQVVTAHFDYHVLDKPVIDDVVFSPSSAPAGTNVMISIAAHDPDGTALTYEAFADGVPLTAGAQPNVFNFTA